MSHEDEFTDLVGTQWQRLVRSAVLLGCTEAEAQDLVQATLERCFVHWTKVRRADDRSAYVHRVLLNTFTSSRRRRWTGEKPTADLPDVPVPDATASVDQSDAVVRALRQLPFDQRVTVVLRFYGNLSEHQLSSALGIAPGTVKSRLSRALTTLSANPDLEELRDLR